MSRDIRTGDLVRLASKWSGGVCLPGIARVTHAPKAGRLGLMWLTGDWVGLRGLGARRDQVRLATHQEVAEQLPPEDVAAYHLEAVQL